MQAKLNAKIPKHIQILIYSNIILFAFSFCSMSPPVAVWPGRFRPDQSQAHVHNVHCPLSTVSTVARQPWQYNCSRNNIDQYNNI